jgi:hypothetical protein
MCSGWPLSISLALAKLAYGRNRWSNCLRTVVNRISMPEGGQQSASDDANTASASAHSGDSGKLIIFISYSRSDMAFADRLVAGLDARGFACRIDRRHLEYGQKWQEMLTDFIAGADTVVFVVSPRSVESNWCRWELAQVATQAKRVIPVVWEPVAPELLPPEIADWHLMPFGADIDFEAAVAKLSDALANDREWVKEHTRLAGLATTWDLGQRQSDALIAGQPLADAERWKDTPRKLNLRPSALVEAFVSASRAEETHRVRRRTRIAWAVAAGACGRRGMARRRGDSKRGGGQCAKRDG